MTRDGPLRGLSIVLRFSVWNTVNRADLSRSGAMSAMLKSKVAGLVTPPMVAVFPMANRINDSHSCYKKKKKKKKKRKRGEAGEMLMIFLWQSNLRRSPGDQGSF